jgi:Zn-dependent membrane protease YugP
VELNASSRALAILSQESFLTAEELQGARKVLNAAALTYVAAALASVLTLVRLLMIRRR